MDKFVLNADIISKINYLYKHLYDNPAENPTNTPKITPNGEKVANLGQISAILGVDSKIAAFYVLQDPEADESLKILAKSEIYPGIYVAAEDSFIPILHKANAMLQTDYSQTEQKGLRIVRTVGGVRRFKQKRGSIIISDGEDPLDALTAMPNDVAGYEKMQGKDGSIYYVGNENGQWVVRDPSSNTVINTAESQEGAFAWLNEHAGGQPHDVTKKPTSSQRVLSHTSRYQGRNVDKNEAARDTTLTREQAVEIVKLNNEQLDLYQRLKTRGLSHEQALILARATSSAKPKPSSPKKKTK